MFWWIVMGVISAILFAVMEYIENENLTLGSIVRYGMAIVLGPVSLMVSLVAMFNMTYDFEFLEDKVFIDRSGEEAEGTED